MDLKVRFLAKIDKTETCWNWVAALRHGYGAIGVKGKTLRAHRVSYEIHIGKIPEGLCVLHKCHNPICVNPSHLYTGTLKENTRDMIKAGRGANQLGAYI